MSICRSTWFFGGTAGLGPFLRPFDVPGIQVTLARMPPGSFSRSVPVSGVYDRLYGVSDDKTGQGTWRVDLEMGFRAETAGGVHRAVAAIQQVTSASKGTLYLVDDDVTKVLTLNDNVAAGSGITVPYDVGPAGDEFYADLDLMMIEGTGGGSDDEVVVASGKIDDTSFVADLQDFHTTGAKIYPVPITYPGAIYRGHQVRQDRRFMATVVFSFETDAAPIFRTNLPP